MLTFRKKHAYFIFRNKVLNMESVRSSEKSANVDQTTSRHTIRYKAVTVYSYSLQNLKNIVYEILPLNLILVESTKY
jgi:hypothetical protein